MPASTPPGPATSRPLGRRSTLALLCGATVAAVAGCASLTDPVVHGTNSLTPPPVPSPAPAFTRAADEVVALRARLVGLAGQVPAPWRDAVAEMLGTHLAVVSSRHPLGGASTPQPWFTATPSASPGAGSLEEFATAATTVAQAHAERSSAAEEPAEAMLWASLAVATGLHTAPGPAPVAGPLLERVEVGTEAECRNVLLAQLHALAQLVEVGIGITSGDARSAWSTRLGQVRTLVAEQQERVRALGADPVGPLPGYDLPGPTDSPAAADATRTLVEQQVFAAHAPVVAASPADQRVTAIAAMQAQGTVVQGRGGAISFFPGWVG